MQRKNVAVKMEEMIPGWLEGYPESKFSVYKTSFLSTKPNSHGFDISEEVLRNCASSILGNFLVAKIEQGDATTHTDDEKIYGYFPKEQSIIFEETDKGYLKASAYMVISKMYGGEINELFLGENFRNASVEMTVEVEDDDHTLHSFDIYGLTCLGRYVNGSCSDANMMAVRFSEEEAKEYYRATERSKSTLQKFVEDRKKNVTYKVNKSKEAMSNKAWGTVDKTALRNKIMDASNKASLVKSVYMKVEAGWEDAPSEKLKYPVMCFDGDTLVYNRGGLSSALGYAKKENETAVVSKVNKIMDSLGLNDKEKMAEIEFSAVKTDSLKEAVNCAIANKPFKLLQIFEDKDKQKFVVLKHTDGMLYRNNFSLTKEGITLADSMNSISVELFEEEVKKAECEDKEVKEEKSEKAQCEDTKEMKEKEDAKCADHDCDDDCDDDKHEEDKKADMADEKKEEMSVEEMAAEIKRLTEDVADRDNIIMTKDAELEELRKFKEGIEKEKMVAKVESVLSEVKGYMTNEQISSFKDEGLKCGLEDIDAWANKVKAFCFEAGKQPVRMASKNIWSFSAPVDNIDTEKKSLWD